MPIIGFSCDKREERVSFEECENCSKGRLDCNITPEYIQYTRKSLQEEKEEDRGISASGLLFCARRKYLEKWVNYYVNPEDEYFKFRGTTAHLLLERHKDNRCITEVRFEREVEPGVIITGKPDKIDVERKILWDYKTVTGKISDDKSLRWGNPKLHNQIQINLYRWIVEEKYNIETLCLVYFGTDAIAKVITKIRTPENKKLWKPMQEAFDRAKILASVWNIPIEEIGNRIPKKETGWICSYCDIKNYCDKYGG